MTMKRRDILKAAAVLPLTVGSAFGQVGRGTKPRKLVKPKRMTPGDTVGVIAPASGLSKENFDKAIANIESLGFKTKIGRNARGMNGIFSGTDRERLEDLHQAFADRAVDGIWCVRGGDGAPRILPEVDFALIRRNPKVFIGYSDITALHLAIHKNCGLVTFHGPVGTSQFSEYTKKHVLNVLTNPQAPYKIELSEFNKTQESELFKTETITKGRCRGKLIGGNLSLLSALAGTPYALKNIKGKILFIEDVDEQPYRVDRMLTQLRQSADLKSLAGVALGVFENSRPTTQKPSPSVVHYLKDRLGDLGIPVIYGLSFGHIRDQFTLPLGIEAELDTETATMTFLESGVV